MMLPIMPPAPPSKDAIFVSIHEDELIVTEGTKQSTFEVKNLPVTVLAIIRHLEKNKR